MNDVQRFRIIRAGWARPLLLLFGATDGQSYVEVRSNSIYARFGWHRIEIPLASIRSAVPSSWPWYAGIGWRSNLRSTLGLIGTYEGIVKLAIDPPQPTRLLLIPFRVRDLYLSLEDPSGFLAALDGERCG